MSLIKRVAQLHIQAHSFERVIYSPKPITTVRAVAQQKEDAITEPNGLWYSCDGDWKRFVQTGMEWAIKSYNHKYLIELNLSRMCVIRNEEEIKDFHDKYSFKVSGYSEGIDWAAVARDYDGIEICPYQYDARFKFGLSWYGSWDVASGCIWSPRALKSIVEVQNDINV